ncbi:MAG: PAS domain S-box protein [Cytophagaceae bacterium]|nr:PAS domain S-box protein [Cytophagaceae bacterium]
MPVERTPSVGGLPLNSASSDLQDLIRNTSDLIQLIDLDGRFLYVNRAWKDATGYRSAQLNAMTIREVIHPEFLDETMAKFERIKNGERIPDFDTVFRRLDGRRVYVSGSVNCRFDEAGQPVAFRCIFHDTTARSRAEKAQNLFYQIASSTLTSRSLDDLYSLIHRELSQVIDTKNFFIALYDSSKSYLYFPYYVDEYFKGNLRFTKRRLGNGLTEFTIAANRPLMLVEEDIRRLAADKQIYLYGQIPKVLLCAPLRIGDRITGIIGVKSYERTNKYDIRDLELLEFISGQVAQAIARKQAEAELGKQTARLHAIFESSSHLMWTVNRRQQLTSFNQNYFNLIRLNLDQVPQVNISTEQLGWQLMGLTNRKIVEEKYRLAFRGVSQYFEIQLNTRSGELWYEMYLNPILLTDGTIDEVAGIARDISPLKKSAQDLLKAKEEAERSLKVKERFLANMSHEIRTPMNGVIGMVDLLSDTPLQLEQREYVQTIKKSSETLLYILNDILDLSKIEAGKMQLHEAPLSLRELFDKLISLFGQTAHAKQNDLRYRFGEGLPQYVIADETRLLQILSNLTSNALKFTENGSVTLTANTIWMKGKWHKIRVEVRDTGIGIAPEGLTQLFGAFNQLDNSSKKSFGGTGLGLAISKELTQLMKGEMGVESVIGRGSVFWFTVELKETTISPMTQQQIEAEQFVVKDFFKDVHPCVLLVDDNAVNRKVASEILLKAGCRVDTADSGRKAIEAVRARRAERGAGSEKKTRSQSSLPTPHTYDLILMDIQMPDMDGVETTRELRRLFGAELPPVVAMTAYSMREDRDRFLSQGLNDYIAKPIRAQALILKVKEWMDAQPSQDVLRQYELKSNQPSPTKAEPTSPVFDREVIDQLCGLGGVEMVVSVFEDFEQEATQQLADAQMAYLRGDFPAVESNLHTLKGNAGTLGIERLHQAVKSVEARTKVGDFSTFEREIPDVVQEFATFREQYKEFLEGL